MTLNRILYRAITIILIFGFYGTSSLVFNEITHGDICPKLLGIPACYIIMLCFVVPLIVHLFRVKNIFYFIGTGIAFSIALYGSIAQLLGIVSCPKTGEGIPMCFISVFIFSVLILLKTYISRSNS